MPDDRTPGTGESTLDVRRVKGHVREVHWRDRDGCSVCILNHEETRLQQPDAPDDVAALIHVGEPPKPHPNGIDNVIDANPAYVNPEQAIEAGLALLEAAGYALAVRESEADEYNGPVNRMTPEQRWRAHVIACGLQDMTFWVHKDPRWPDHYYAIEVETGCGAWGATAEEATRNYFAGNHDQPHPPVGEADRGV